MKHIIVALGMLASVAAQASMVKSENADIVTTVFAWQPEKTIDVQFSLDSQGTSNASTIKGAYTINTLAHDQGLELRFSNMDTQVSSDDPRLKGVMGEFMNTVMQQSPSYVIDQHGLLASLTGMKEFRSNINTGLKPVLKDVPNEVRPQLDKMLAALTSEAQLMQGMSDDWNRIVGAWVGGEFELNEIYDLEFEVPVPALGNMPITMTSEFSYLGKVPCNAADKAKKCIKLSAFTHIDEIEGKRFMSAFALKFNIPNGDKLTLRMDTEIKLVTEASTLYPHHVVERKTVTMPTPRGEQQKIDTKEYSFNYK